MDCVDYIAPPRWNPYLPSLDLGAAAFAALPSPAPPVAALVVTRHEDEVLVAYADVVTTQTHVPEPGVSLLLLAVCLAALIRRPRR